MASRIQVRRGTEADWTNVASSVTLAAGEPAVATGNSKGPLLYFGDGTTLFSGLKAQVASFTPQSGSNTRYGHVTATDEDYTFTMLAAGDNARALGMASGGSLTFKSGSSMTVDDTATVNFDNVPDFNKGMIAYVGEDDNSDGVTEGGTVLVKRGAAEVLKVDDYGNVALTPVNDSGTVDPNLKLKMSDNADVGLQVTNPTDGEIFSVHDDQVKSVQQLIMGPVPDHAIPSTFAKIRSGTNPDNTDSGSLTNYFNGTPHFLLEVGGDSTTNQRGKLVVVGNRNAGTGQTALQISKNGEQDSRFAADYGGNLAITGQLTAQNLVVPNVRCQTVMAQSNTQTDYTIANDDDHADLPSLGATKITPLSVTITPNSASSKILIEFAVYGNYRSANNSAGGDLGGTLVRSIGGGSEVDLAGTNTTSAVKALFFGSNQGRTDSAAGRANSNFHGHFIDEPNTTSAVTYTFAVKGGGFDSNASGTYNFNKSSEDVGDNNLLINFHSTIIATDIPQ